MIEQLLPWIPLHISHVEAIYKSFFIIIIICTIFLTFKYLKRITSNVKQINNKKSCKNEYKKIQITFLKNTHSMINGVIFCGFLMWMIGSSLFIFILLLLCKVLLSTYMFTNVCTTLQAMFLSPFIHLLIYDQNIKFELSGDTLDPRETAFIVSNHMGHDYLPLFMLSAHLKMLGHVRGMLKNSIKYIPLIGWNMFMSDWFFLRRSWTKDAMYIESKIRAIKKNGIGLHFWIFPEGTRPTPEKRYSSLQYEHKNQLRPLTYVMQPRTKGFITLVKNMNGICNILYNVTLKYEGWDSDGGPTFHSFLFPSKKQKTCFIHVTKINMTDKLDKNDLIIREWCFYLFHQKDLLLKYFDGNGKFPGNAKTMSIPTTQWFSCFLFFTILQGCIYYMFVHMEH